MDIELIWVKREAEYFCKGGWTGRITLIRFNKLVFAREARESKKRAQTCGQATTRPDR